jgi:hypothetical protein
MAPASESGGKASKAIHQRHLEAGISDVLAGKRAMRQSLFGSDNPTRRQRDALASPIAALLLTLAAFFVALLG